MSVIITLFRFSAMILNTLKTRNIYISYHISSALTQWGMKVSSSDTVVMCFDQALWMPWRPWKRWPQVLGLFLRHGLILHILQGAELSATSCNSSLLRTLPTIPLISGPSLEASLFGVLGEEMRRLSDLLAHKRGHQARSQPARLGTHFWSRYALRDFGQVTYHVSYFFPSKWDASCPITPLPGCQEARMN